MTIVADTGGIYALYDAADRHHEAVRRIVESTHQMIVVPIAVVPEVDYFLGKYLGPKAARDFLDSVSQGAFVLDHMTVEDIDACRKLIETYSDLELGFVDAAVVTVAERLRTCDILTLDERDFRAVGRHRHGPLVLLPADAD